MYPGSVLCVNAVHHLHVRVDRAVFRRDHIKATGHVVIVSAKGDVATRGNTGKPHVSLRIIVRRTSAIAPIESAFGVNATISIIGGILDLLQRGTYLVTIGSRGCGTDLQVTVFDRDTHFKSACDGGAVIGAQDTRLVMDGRAARDGGEAVVRVEIDLPALRRAGNTYRRFAVAAIIDHHIGAIDGAAGMDVLSCDLAVDPSAFFRYRTAQQLKGADVKIARQRTTVDGKLLAACGLCAADLRAATHGDVAV